METLQDATHESTVNAGAPEEPFRLRSYQAEMVEESLTENIIVAMDTGSGKTHIALARTAVELENCNPDKLVWFLAPTVTLCHQQYHVFRTHLPAFGVRFLSGDDDIDRWTDQAIWDAVLKNIRIVVSTHAVLLDALSHGFVQITQLALMIFDEAHHCTLKHPANQIMKRFYMPLALTGQTNSIPRILGLSASPVINAKAGGLQTIEQNLNAITKTPKIHRSELMRFVHRPELTKVIYLSTQVGVLRSPPLLSSLEKIHSKLDIMQDPYVTGLIESVKSGDKDAPKRLHKVLVSQDTYCRKQLKVLVTRTKDVYNELGAFAADWYLRQCIMKYTTMLQQSDQQFNQWVGAEKKYLQEILQNVLLDDAATPLPLLMEHISPKVQSLIDALTTQSCPGFTGLVFVEQRAVVAALAQLLAIHPRTQPLFNVGTFVGTSTSSKRKGNIADLAEPRNQQQTLDDFRQGKKNLVIATCVLEEGIDVSSCHIVICFEPPKNLKSFIQRRGRARKEESKYIILIPDCGSALASPDRWHDLEEEMKEAYLNDLREIKAAEERELAEENEDLLFHIDSTGALLTLDNASQHLHHFCALLQSSSYIDMRPQFSFDKDTYDMITATVTLPISVDAAVRTAKSSRYWQTERNAKRDAAFQAYKALHAAGLINDNLLPLLNQQGEKPEFNVSDDRPSLVLAAPRLDPWISVAEQQLSSPSTYHRVLLSLVSPEEKPLKIVMLTPVPMPYIPPVVLHWNETKKYVVTAWPLDGKTYEAEEIQTMRAITRKLLCSVYESRMTEERYDFISLFVPGGPLEPWTFEEVLHWHYSTEGSRPILELSNANLSQPDDFGIVHEIGKAGAFIFKNIRLPESESTVGISNLEEGPQVEVLKFPKRRDFLHRIPDRGAQVNEAYTTVQSIDARDCSISLLPASFAIFALFIPSILHRYEIFLIAETLRTTILAPVSLPLSSLNLLVTATTASSTNESCDYQRLEFLGDCILKVLTSLSLMAAHPNWPESYLTASKGRTNSNGFLAKATLAAGLDKFITTKAFTGAKWCPRYSQDILSSDNQEKERPLRSTKLLADVVESLIGACYIEGGLSKAITCIQTLLPTEPWIEPTECRTLLFDAAPSHPSPTHLLAVENLIDYKFTKKCLLLEALTHASYVGPAETATSSYQRLEFLGDAILDYIVVKRLYAHTPELSHQKMHSIRTAMVNATFLAFLAFETTVLEEQFSITTNPVTGQPALKPAPVAKALWQFLRYSSQSIFGQQQAAVKRHKASRDEILHELQHGRQYPWHLFARIDAEKFFSDIVESVIGAVYVDSRGDISACERFIKKLGILDSLERVLRDNVDCLHPKERLGHLAINDKVEYVPIGKVEDGRYKCQVKVGKKEIGGVAEGKGRVNAETEAAWRAVGILEGEGGVQLKTFDGAEAFDGVEAEVGEASMEMERGLKRQKIGWRELEN